MRSYYVIAMWLVVALSPLGMFFINFEFGAARNLALLNFLPMYLLLAAAMGITAFVVGVRSFSLGHFSRKDRVVGGAALAFLIIFVLSLAFQREAFEHGAKARIDSLGGQHL